MTWCRYQLFFMFVNIFCYEVHSYIPPSISQNQTESRIVGGRVTKIDEAPFVASLKHKTVNLASHVCGATILTERHLITAGHCVTVLGLKKIKRRGSLELLNPKYYVVMTSSIFLQEGKHTRIFRFFVHPNFKPATLEYDFGAIALKKKLIFSLHTMPAKLPQGTLKETSYSLELLLNNNEICKTYGWGSTIERKSFVLRVVKIPVISSDLCASIIRTQVGSVYNESFQFCAMDAVHSRDACQGDSGGPMLCKDLLWGVVSWGEGCGRKGEPGIYARVDVAMAWLRQHVFNIPIPNKSSSIRSLGIQFLLLFYCLTFTLHYQLY